MDIKEIRETEYKRGFVEGIKEAEKVRAELEDLERRHKEVNRSITDAAEVIRKLREDREAAEARKDELLVRYANLKLEAEDLQYRHDRLQDFEVAEAKQLEAVRRENRMLRDMLLAMLGGAPEVRSLKLKPYEPPKVEFSPVDWRMAVRMDVVVL